MSGKALPFDCIFHLCSILQHQTGSFQFGIGIVPVSFFEHVGNQIEDEWRMNSVTFTAEEIPIQTLQKTFHAFPKNSPMV